jgi:hypothetical protein
VDTVFLFRHPGGDSWEPLMHPVGLPHRDPYTYVDHQAGDAVAVDEHDLFVLDLRCVIGVLTVRSRGSSTT